jgi:hypothetical protein
MNRRELLKAMAVVPVASALGSCHEDVNPSPEPQRGVKIHTLQVLLEGPFAVVLLRNKPNRLIAFVPRPPQEQRTLTHDFFFNDPSAPRPATKKQEGYAFQLGNDGLRTYSEVYLNPGFADFQAETQKWRLPESLVKLELPFPDSINFSGRPLRVKFASGKSGLMPTNYILEYYVTEAEKLNLMCPQIGGKCPSSPNCPPGIARYFFGVSPQIKDDPEKHALEFFNFMLHVSFPELEDRFRLTYIEPSEQQRRSSLPLGIQRLVPAVMKSTALEPRLLPVAAVLDCQIGGILVTTNSGAGGG